MRLIARKSLRIIPQLAPIFSLAGVGLVFEGRPSNPSLIIESMCIVRKIEYAVGVPMATLYDQVVPYFEPSTQLPL
ncbi:hypothetical protein [Kaarinaea lacus]